LNYISYEFYCSQLIQNMNCTFRSTDINVKAANSSLIKCQGIITIPLEINGRECNVDFCILEGLSHVVLVANLTNKDIKIPAGTIVTKPGKLDHDFEVNNELTLLFSLFNLETQSDPKINDAEMNEEESRIELVKQFKVKPEDHKPEQILTLAKLLKKYGKVFVQNDTNLKQCPLVQHVVDTGDCRPINQPPYRTNLETKQIVDEIIKKHLSNRFIEPSSSPWASPVVLVSKRMEV
jgi:hypothetical protein